MATPFVDALDSARLGGMWRIESQVLRVLVDGLALEHTLSENLGYFLHVPSNLSSIKPFRDQAGQANQATSGESDIDVCESAWFNEL